MIVQAIGLLDELDKEINTYAMRVKEWYGWHFPEMAKIVTETIDYSRVVLKVCVVVCKGARMCACACDACELRNQSRGAARIYPSANHTPHSVQRTPSLHLQVGRHAHIPATNHTAHRTPHSTRRLGYGRDLERQI